MPTGAFLKARIDLTKRKNLLVSKKYLSCLTIFDRCNNFLSCCHKTHAVVELIPHKVIHTECSTCGFTTSDFQGSVWIMLVWKYVNSQWIMKYSSIDIRFLQFCEGHMSLI